MHDLTSKRGRGDLACLGLILGRFAAAVRHHDESTLIELRQQAEALDNLRGGHLHVMSAQEGSTEAGSEPEGPARVGSSCVQQKLVSLKNIL